MSGGCLYVAEDNYDEFLGIYAAEIRNGNKTLSFSELRSPDVFRMYFDVDILDTKTLNEEFLLRLSRNIQTTIGKFFPGIDPDSFKAVLCSTATKKVEVSEVVPPLQKPIGLPYKKTRAGGEEDVEQQEPTRVLRTFTKNGYHILFPFLRVTLPMALQLRFSVVSDLEKTFGKREVAVNPWADVLDKAPYYGGLKMCGSVKSVTCTDCKGKKKNVRRKPVVKDIITKIRRLRKKLYPRKDDPLFDYSNVMTIAKDEFKNEDLADLYSAYQDETGFLMCPKCGDKGTHLEDRYYMPVAVLDPDGTPSGPDLDHLNDDMHELMRWTSIRCGSSDQSTEGYVVPRGYQPSIPDGATGCLQIAGGMLERLSPGIYREAVNSEMFLNDALGIRTWKGKEILDPQTLAQITKEVRSFDDRYKEVDVRQVFEVKVVKSYMKPSISSDTRSHVQATSQTSAVQKSLVKKKNVRTKHSSSATKAMTNIVMANKVASATDRVLEMFSRVQVRVSGIGSTYCTNKGDEHNSNSVFFWISEEGMTQKCFSRKDAIGIHGKTCKDFRSAFKNISPPLRDLLFTETNLFDTDKLKNDGTMSKVKDQVVSGTTRRPRDVNANGPSSTAKGKRRRESQWDAMC